MWFRRKTYLPSRAQRTLDEVSGFPVNVLMQIAYTNSPKKHKGSLISSLVLCAGENKHEDLVKSSVLAIGLFSTSYQQCRVVKLKLLCSYTYTKAAALPASKSTTKPAILPAATKGASAAAASSSLAL